MNLIRLALLVMFLVPAHAQEANEETSEGERLYIEFGCYTCHGYGGTGMTRLANGVSGVMSDEQVYLTYLRLRADQNPVNPSRSMPNYDASTLSDEQAIAIFNYINTLRDDPPEVDEIPAFVEILDAAEQKSERDER